MGTKLSPILETREINISDLSGKKVVVDAFNILYQFLSTIRQPDGSLLMDSKGRTTSHLSGLFFRMTKLMSENIKIAFVFDGKAPELKAKERERRHGLKEEAIQKYKIAEEQGDIELMKKYASRTAKLTPEMIAEAKEVLGYLGIPIIQAPSEGEAQAAHMVSKGEFYGLVSQDTDGLLFGTTRLLKNLSITGKRRKAGTSVYQAINPEIVDLSENLNLLGIDRDQLVVVGILCGTDFNIGGVKGIGPKKALGLVKKHGKDFEKVFEEASWNEFFDFSWKEVFDIITKMPVIDDYSLEWKSIDKEKILSLLVDKHEFSSERVENALDKVMKRQAQKGLSDFF